MDTIDRIFDLMQKRGITMATLARETGLSTGLISQWNKRLQQPSNKKLEIVADYFGVSVDYLLGKDTERVHYEKLDDLYYNAVIKWSEDKLFTEEETTEIKLHFSDLLLRYKKLIESTVNCKLSLSRYLESISTFNNESEKPLTTQELIERYLSQELERERNDLKSWIDAAPYRFSLAMEKCFTEDCDPKDDKK